jgi:trk system potassium uptake protein TrkA
MYVIIAGAGIIGKQVAHLLVESRYDIVVIDKDPEICQAVYEETGAVTINADARNLNTLKQAGADKANVILCLMHYSADNLACALLAKSLGIPRIIARLRDPQYEKAYQLAGVTTIVRMADLLVNQIMTEIEQPKVRKILTLSGGKADIYSVRVPAKAKSIGMTIKEIAEDRRFPDECVFIGIYRDDTGDFQIPRGNHKIRDGDHLFLSSKSQFIKQATDVLTQ